MIPLRDLIPRAAYPAVTWVIVGVNAAVWVLTSGDLDEAVRALGAVPYHFTGLEPSAVFDPQTGHWMRPVPKNTLWEYRIITHMFTHAGLMHILGNMWFLWVFGDNVEDRLGHLRYALLYLVSGLIALAAQVIANPASGVPMIGASGAVAGVLGAYLRLFPHARVLAIIPPGFFVVWPSIVFLGLWLAIQLMSGFGSIGVEGGGVAWWAHVGGFVFGFLGAHLLAPKRARIEVEIGGRDAPR